MPAGEQLRDDQTPPAYYPGDDQVDWLCADVYAIGNDRSFGDVAGRLHGLGRLGHDKPV